MNIVSSGNSEEGRRPSAWVMKGNDLEKTEIKLGFIPLTDCAPLVVASKNGYFEKYGLNVTLLREMSWANIRDKVGMGLLDGGHMLAAMPIASSLGIGPTAVPMVTALSLDLNGNAITVSNALYQRMNEADPEAMRQPATAAQALKRVIDEDRKAGKPPLTFAMVFPFSTHNYLLRYWLASSGIDPDKDIDLVVVPPPQMARSLAAGNIAGYCVGEPWNEYAVQEGLGQTLITSYEIWNNHPEKVLGVTRDWAERYPNTHKAVIKALLEAAQWLDQTANREAVSEILAEDDFVAASPAVIRASMTGDFRYTTEGAPVSLPDFNVFQRYAATFPWRSHAAWLVTQMYRWGQIEQAVDIRHVAESVYLTELYREVAGDLDLPYPKVDYKPEGQHAERWQLQAGGGITMGPDRFCDGTSFDPADLLAYLESFEVSHCRVSWDALKVSNRPGG